MENCLKMEVEFHSIFSSITVQPQSYEPLGLGNRAVHNSEMFVTQIIKLIGERAKRARHS